MRRLIFATLLFASSVSAQTVPTAWRLVAHAVDHEESTVRVRFIGQAGGSDIEGAFTTITVTVNRGELEGYGLVVGKPQTCPVTFDEAYSIVAGKQTVDSDKIKTECL